jgi:hypothetical protein
MWLFFFIFVYIETFLYIIIYKSIIMSVGNLKTYGGKGTNMPWQLKMLLGQECACDNLTDINTNTSNVDSLLNQILAAIQAGADYEASLIVDANDVTWLEVRIYNPDTGTFNPPVYFQAGSNTPGTPVAPITYVNPNSYLATLVTNTTSIQRTPNFIRVTGSGSIAVETFSVSVANVGTGNGTVLGSTIKSGETLNFDAGSLNNYYTTGTFTYNGTGTELIIIYNS